MEVKNIDISKRSFHVHTRHHSLTRTIHPESRVLSIQYTSLTPNEGLVYLETNLKTAISFDSSSPRRVPQVRFLLGVHGVRVRTSDRAEDEGPTQDLCASIEIKVPAQHSFAGETDVRSSLPVMLEVPILACTISEKVPACQPRLAAGDVFSRKLSGIHQGSRIPSGPTTSPAFHRVFSPSYVVMDGEVIDHTRGYGDTHGEVVVGTKWRQRRVWFIDLTQLSLQDSTVLIDQTTGRILVPTALQCKYNLFPPCKDVASGSPRAACEDSNQTNDPLHSEGTNNSIVKQLRVVLLNDLLSLDHLIQKTEIEGGNCMSIDIPILNFRLASINLCKRPCRE
ncbi:unnamed protein product [Phytomonas sp. Hart1]|nr:unnamed protein product [Phytomonas sp. Hart1]|eukprot:CCW67326.1 unnamed protein product [Phytomonas sp. isolate Hart1]